eukprot:TRINITY_DN2505_c0_g2_i1.p1 TRINITY_DN2505_c0_g2~~TRINITY_DN2505_c0_g2_i1.p1  ORF type:complete len:112 (+),score=2.84 TRINITY_DN2505_c0_g2_i1:283-618(+)
MAWNGKKAEITTSTHAPPKMLGPIRRNPNYDTLSLPATQRIINNGEQQASTWFFLHPRRRTQCQTDVVLTFDFSSTWILVVSVLISLSANIAHQTAIGAVSHSEKQLPTYE